MKHSPVHLVVLTITLLIAASLSTFGEGGAKADYERALSLNRLTEGKTFRAKVEPHWLPGGESFWYRNDLPAGAKEFVLINAVTGERSLVEDASKLPKD